MAQAIEEIVETAATSRTERQLPETIGALGNIAWNYWWSWSPDGAGVFRDLDAGLWEECEHNPIRLLARVPDLRLLEMGTDPIYIERVNALSREFELYMGTPLRTWGRADGEQISANHPIAYFCAEYGVHNSLPLYSGGLGILAGDHLKSASDLGLPLIAVGLLYRYGYFRQHLTRDGWQEEHYAETHPSELPITLVRDSSGSPLSIEIEMRGRLVRAVVWRVEAGRVPLYLLDTNIPENEETDRWITAHLYGGDRETRVVQEMVLGIGGVRVLRALGVEPHVYHLNEGHSAFLTLELAREMTVSPERLSFAEASRRVRERCVFTTHTPVAAGNDEFSPALIEKCFGAGFETELGLTHEEFLNLGRVAPVDPSSWFGLTPLAIRMCRSTNGVSRRHGEVSRALWQQMFPAGTSLNDVPITSVTNGVHAPTWVAPLLRAVFTHWIGQDWDAALLEPELWARGIANIPDEELWQTHSLLKERLVAFVRQRSYRARKQRAERAEYIEAARTMFDPQALTIGFARRVAGYKRWDLLLADPDRLQRILYDQSRPIQFVFAGKAHPQDQEAKLVLQQIALWKLDPRVMERAVFIEDYDQEIARQLVQSVDVWLNVPRRPYEASGTSGEKVAMNGGLNLSVLDGWWIEGYDGTNGWAVGDIKEEAEEELARATTAQIDARDAASLYRLLEEEVVPLYYEHDARGIPTRWIGMMKRSLQTLAPKFNSDRMVVEYAREIYVGRADR